MASSKLVKDISIEHCCYFSSEDKEKGEDNEIRTPMNLASVEIGAKIVDCSSEVEPASSVLDSNLSTLWLTEEGFPQWICISLKGLCEYLKNKIAHISV